MRCLQTCEFSDSPLSTARSFSRLRISGLAALMSIFRLEVGVQGSLDGASRPLVGVVRGPMFLWLSSNAVSEALLEFFSCVCGSTKTCPYFIENTLGLLDHNHDVFQEMLQEQSCPKLFTTKGQKQNSTEGCGAKVIVPLYTNILY